MNNLSNCRRVKKECIDTVIGKSYVGDWFLFYLLGQNIDSVIFKVLKKFRNVYSLGYTNIWPCSTVL